MDGALVFRALENMVTNAFMYAGTGSLISFRATRKENLIALELCNSGDEIAAKDLDLIFEPFYRGSGARSEPGFGLGL